MKIKSFKLKLILSYVFVIIFTFGLVAFFLDKNLEDNSLRELKTSLINQAQLIESELQAKLITPPDLPALEALTKDLSLKIKSRVTIIDTKGRVLVDSEKSLEEALSMDNHADRPEIKLALNGLTGQEIRYSPTLKINMLYVAVPIKTKGSISGAVRLALPLANVEKMLNGIRNAIIFSIIFALGLAFVLGSLLTAGIIKPINKIIYISRKFSSGDFTHRIYHDSKDEVGELAATLNKMAEDIENKIKEIKTQNQELSAVFNSMIEGVIVIDRSGRIVSVNQTVEKIFGIIGRETEGRIFLEAVRNNDIAEVIDTVIKEGKPVSKEIALIFPVSRTFEISATPIFDNEAVSGCLVVIHDITEIRRLETVRSDFIANVSHELKTPLTSIKGFVETLLEGALSDNENNRNFLKVIQEHTERMNCMVDDLLSLAHLESKDITLQRSSFNLRHQLEELISGFRSQLKKKNIEIKDELPADIAVTADKNRIQQVFTNLIDNAIKFNKDNGWIKVYGQEINGKIKICIEDSGAGIPQKDIPRIFERFYRVDKARSRELGGTGLGLSIVRHIIELHNGSVGVESTEGFGSKFWFILPK
jgi:two-component system phosphate regulon sensor histidine kinase PhoR